MPKYLYQEIEEILNEPFLGHPSRKEQHEIEQIKKAIIYLAKNLPVGRI